MTMRAIGTVDRYYRPAFRIRLRSWAKGLLVFSIVHGIFLVRLRAPGHLLSPKIVII